MLAETNDGSCATGLSSSLASPSHRPKTKITVGRTEVKKKTPAPTALFIHIPKRRAKTKSPPILNRHPSVGSTNAILRTSIANDSRPLRVPYLLKRQIEENGGRKTKNIDSDQEFFI
jgi:hypothetical protein